MTPEAVKPNPGKIRAIQKTVKELNVVDEGFLSTFVICKNILYNQPVPQYPDIDKTFNLTTDATNVAIGDVLSQGLSRRL